MSLARTLVTQRDALSPAPLAGVSDAPPDPCELRLRLTPSPLGSGALDGAWWPYTRDLAREARNLVDDFPGRDTVYRVTYSAPDWDPVSQHRFRADKVFVTLGSFPDEDTHLALLTGVSGSQALHVLVVPPVWGAHAAHRAMRVAATSTNALAAAAILEKARTWSPNDLLDHWSDDGGAGTAT